MKASELIEKLQKFNGELEVTTSDRKGTFSDILSVEEQNWKNKDGNHSSITIVIGGYDTKRTLVDDINKNTLIEIELDGEDDEKFIDNVNKELCDDCKISKNESLEAKKAFNHDITEMQKKYKKWFNEKYDNIARESMLELFGDDEPLNNKTTKDLKLHVYENGWQEELDKDELNNRNVVLRLLYNKLSERVKEKLSNDTEKLWNDINGCYQEKRKRSESQNEEYQTTNLFDLMNSFKDDFFNDDWLNNFMKLNHLFFQ